MLSEQQKIRHEEYQALIDAGILPYPAPSFSTTHRASSVRHTFDTSSPSLWEDVCLAGRLMSKRVMGKASFAEVEDSSGRLQWYISRDFLRVGAHDVWLKGKPLAEAQQALYNRLFKQWLSLGDIIGARGRVFKTKKGEISLEVRELCLLSKALRPLPVVKRSTDEKGVTHTHDAFENVEQRYRQRHVDLIVNPSRRKRLALRTQIVQSMRNFLNKRSYLEVETPILQPVWGGASARPFATHFHALDMPLYLRIANELYLKRLIVGGYDGVYEFSKDFRNEGLSRFHNVEFTQMELYVAYKDYFWMRDYVKDMLRHVVSTLHEGRLELSYGGKTLSFAHFDEIRFFDALEEYTGVDLRGLADEKVATKADIARLYALSKTLKVDVEARDTVPKLLDKVFSLVCEPRFIQPTFVMDYPVCLSPLAKSHRSVSGLVERFELICCGKEICNAYSELNDPIEQRMRFEEQVKQSRQGDEEATPVIDENFLQALEYGMPPTAGLGIGMDRLSMILLDEASIQDVLFFPLMRQE